MELTNKQLDIKDKIIKIATAMGIDPLLAVAVAMTESSLGINQKSPTGCVGVFQMSSIAMKDLLQEMKKQDDDIIDIACGVAFLHLLLKRHGNVNEAISHFCDPADRAFYIDRVNFFMEVFK
jgi:membrane-bound lytic murein transglycosylase MltF